MKRRSFRTVVGLVATGVLLVTSSGCATAPGDSVTTLTFFQYKGEAVDDFARIIERFEKENPDIRVEQDQVADSESAIRTLLVKDRTPDVITLNAGATYGSLARSGVFADFSDEPVLQTINPAVQDILGELGNYKDEVNGLGFVSNANGIIYNRDIFAAQGLEVPQTWPELIETCEKLQAAGITPFAATLGDSWTVLPSWNAIGAYYATDGFFDKLREEGEEVGPNSPVSFEKDFPDAMKRQSELYAFTQPGGRGALYDEGSSLFATGKVAMLMQGNWALSPVKRINPDINTGIFPYPVPENPADRVLVSGVDVVVTMGKDTAHPQEAQRFIDFLFRPDIVEEYARSQTMVPAVEAAKISEDPALQSVAPWFADGRITGFIDHQIPPATPLEGILQQAVFDGDGEGAMRTLDAEWRKVAARTIDDGAN